MYNRSHAHNDQLAMTGFIRICHRINEYDNDDDDVALLKKNAHLPITDGLLRRSRKNRLGAYRATGPQHSSTDT